MRGRLPLGAKEQGGKIYDIATPCRLCYHYNSRHADSRGHCPYRQEGFDPNQVIMCGDKWTEIQKRR